MQKGTFLTIIPIISVFKDKQIRNLVEVLNHYLVLILQSQVKVEAQAISEKLEFLCQNYSKFEYDATKIAKTAEICTRSQNLSGIYEQRQPRKKNTPRKRPLLKQELSGKMALVDKMVQDTDFATGLADAINTASNGEGLQNIDFDTLSFSRSFYES